MSTARTAHYLDGRTATRHRVTLTISPAALQIAMPDGSTKEWPYGQIRQTQGTYRGEPVRLEFGTEPAEAVVVASRALLTDIHTAAPALAQHFHDPSWRQRRLAWTLGAGLGVIVMLIGLYRWGIPGIASAATPYVPIMWEESLGRQIVQHLAPETQQCREPERLRKIDQVVQTLAATHPDSPYRITLSVVDNPAINAFAAPGGHVVVLRGLLEQTGSAEQLAGVLAHELQHVYLRHSTRAILEQTAGTLLLTAVSGDLSGGLAWGLQGAQTMGSLHYSRTHEEEADVEGLRMMQAAHLDPTAMIAFYGTLQKSEQDHIEPPDFLSTHPDMSRRLATLLALAGPPPTDARQLLPGEDWKDIRTLCRLQTATRSSSDSPDLP
ncbi:MAG TPA: M48 family metallopeptidase [Nitrospira sp.]|nr:M48 family metallopeptidase [Nitrospira sp.]HNA84582.1 M48 family metallopeptidase [Nitrospira sp.]